MTPAPSVVTFFMAGFPRCGTTWVYKAIKNHPQVFLPAQKQTYFFDVNYDRGIDWYLQQFSGVASGHRAVGEIATGYTLPHALPRLAEHFPHARILLAVRNPVDRAYSYFTSRSVRHEWKDFRAACKARPAILDQGKYIDHVERVASYFDEGQIGLFFHDDLKADDRAYLRQILEFIGVDAEYNSPEIGRVVQVSAFPRLRRFLRKARLSKLVDRVSDSPLGDAIRKQLVDRGVERYPGMDESTRQFLLEVYRPYNERLEAYSGRDLAHWMV